MSSYFYGKPEICAWIRKWFPWDAEILDVGACDGLWRRLLPDFPNMDAVEAYAPHLPDLEGYRQAFLADIRAFEYDYYDLIIFGDIIEHLTPNEARVVLEYARPRCRDLIIAVPYQYEQGAIYGNPYEVHVQDDLTPEIFQTRYPGFEVLLRAADDYCYYRKGEMP